ncbi:MAG: hypothetical protein KY469_10545 [Actinobacteria bacterium]|nr:hypothetical protein [Actinomycetota bacterium]
MATTFSPAVLAKADDCTVTHAVGELYTVVSPSGATYGVHTDGKTGVCNCPARTPRCAHLAAALVHISDGRLDLRDPAPPISDPFEGLVNDDDPDRVWGRR